MKIPKSHPVQPLKDGQAAIAKCTCGHCGLSWDDGKVTSMTPVPSARCPFEAFHVYENEKFPVAFVPSLGADQEKRFGEMLVKALELTPTKRRGKYTEPVYATNFGVKTSLGLARVVVNLLDEALSLEGAPKS